MDLISLQWIIGICMLAQCRPIIAPDPNQGDGESEEDTVVDRAVMANGGYDGFVTQLNTLLTHCQRNFGTTDPLLIEDTIMRLEGVIRTLRIVNDLADTPISTQGQDFVSGLEKDVEVILSMWRNCACNHRQLGKCISRLT
jgi:hypothetical protein